MKNIDTTTNAGVVKFFETHWEELDLFKANNIRYLYLSDCNYSGGDSMILFKEDNKLMFGLLRDIEDDPEQKIHDTSEFDGDYLYFTSVKLRNINLYSHFRIK